MWSLNLQIEIIFSSPILKIFKFSHLPFQRWSAWNASAISFYCFILNWTFNPILPTVPKERPYKNIIFKEIVYKSVNFTIAIRIKNSTYFIWVSICIVGGEVLTICITRLWQSVSVSVLLMCYSCQVRQMEVLYVVKRLFTGGTTVCIFIGEI